MNLRFEVSIQRLFFGVSINHHALYQEYYRALAL